MNLSVIFVPVAGVLIIDALFIRPMAYHIDALETNRSFNGRGFFAWGVGALIAILASDGIIGTLTGVAALDAILVSGVIYTVSAWRQREVRGA